GCSAPGTPPHGARVRSRTTNGGHCSASDRCLAPAQRVLGTASEKPCQAPPAAEPDTSGSGTARGRAGHPISREEVVAAAPQRQERRRDAHPGEQLDALDEREPAPRFEAAGEH